jgi:type IV pilus assembly protein PilE
MVALAIIGILAAIAIPGYQAHVTKTRRYAAQTCLMEQAQYMERYYTTNNMTYVGATLPSTQCTLDLDDYYSFLFGLNQPPTASTFVVRASGTARQAAADPTCPAMSLSNTGARVPANGCWP